MWWKTDLQVATPAYHGFRLEAGSDVRNDEGRQAFARRYVAAVVERSIDVIVLADHHTCEWLDPLRSAASEAGVVVFPGVEVTTGTGSDGVHLVIIGDLDKTDADVDRMLRTVCGFEDDHPMFDVRTGEPAPARRSIADILDGLPEDWLVLAPHVLNDNGIASSTTVKGSVRWKALHHDRLNAIDVGHPSTELGGFNSRFRARDLDHFPCLEHLAFVSTSDAYSVDDLGSRFTWVRMAEPSLEGLRQAFLDHEARIICDWEPRLQDFKDANPNNIGHAWVEGILIDGAATASGPIDLKLDPRLNVVIGGRGSGKSTLVAALRQVYSSVSDLPASLRSDAASFVEAVLKNATITCDHRLTLSQEPQRARWDAARGSITQRRDQETETEYPVRVVSQKELYERVAGDSLDPSVASRNLLSIVDESIEHADPLNLALTFSQALNAARGKWTAAIQVLRSATEEVKREPSITARIGELDEQVRAFDSDTARARRENNERRVSEMARVTQSLDRFSRMIELVDEALPDPGPTTSAPGTQSDELDAALTEVATAAAAFDQDMRAVIQKARDRLATLLSSVESGPLAVAVAEAQHDFEELRAELAALGMDTDSYDSVRRQLQVERDLLDDVVAREEQVPALTAEVAAAWSALMDLAGQRRRGRQELVDEVANRSGALRFGVSELADVGGWVNETRSLLSLRSDAFLEEVPAVGRWLCDSRVDVDKRRDRFVRWRDALVENDYSGLRLPGVRQSWWTRLQGADEAIRLRLATEYPEDLIQMSFLREGGDPTVDGDWQLVSQGSPGQRSAAMLSFVLHHGEEPLVLDQPEDDLDSAWISGLIIRELRRSRWSRQVIVVTHNANIPVNGDSERVIVMENRNGVIGVRGSEDGVPHVGPIEDGPVREDIQQVMEGGVRAFIQRERRYNNELSTYRVALRGSAPPGSIELSSAGTDSSAVGQ